MPRRAPLLLDDIRVLLTSLSAEAGGWPTGVAARRDAALLLMGFAGAHRRSELTALTLEDVTLHPSDGLHVRLRRSKTDQEARGTVTALPYGRDPATCPPCAYIQWRQILQASWRGCRTGTSPGSLPATSPSRTASRLSGRRRGSGPFVRPTTRSCVGRARSSAG